MEKVLMILGQILFMIWIMSGFNVVEMFRNIKKGLEVVYVGILIIFNKKARNQFKAFLSK